MKKNMILYVLVGVLVAVIGFNACTPDYETNFEEKTLVVPDKCLSPIYFNIEGGEKEITVNTNVPTANWTATSNADWVKVHKTDGKVTITADPSSLYTTRVARVNIAYGHQSYDIVVTQFGKESIILIDGKREGVIKEVPATQKLLEIEVVTNLNLDNIVIPDTVSWVKQAPVSRLSEDASTQTLAFALDMNTDTVPRFCSIILQSSDNYDYITTFIIKQLQRGYIVEAADSVKNLRVPASGKTITIPFEVNGPQGTAYTFEIEESSKNWIEPVSTPATRSLRPVSESFIVKPNILEKERVGTITFRSTDPEENSSFVVTIIQDKFVPVPPQNVVNAKATAGNGFIVLSWMMPEHVDFTTMTISYFDPVFKREIIKTIDNNTTVQYKIDQTFKAAGEYEFTIKTFGPTGMETETPVVVRGRSEAAPDFLPVELTVDMLSTNAQEPLEGPIANLVDGNVNTYFHSAWSISIKEPHYFQLDLKKGIEAFRYDFSTRHNGDGGGDVKRMKIEASNDGITWIEVATHSYTLPGSRGATVNGQEVTMDNVYTKLRFTPLARRSADPINNSWFNMSEFYLYEKNIYTERWAEAQL